MKKTINLFNQNSLVIILLFIAIISILFRSWGTFSALPYMYHSDEPKHIIRIIKIFETGNLNPHFFNYPSMFLYVNAFSYFPYYYIGHFFDFFSSPAEITSPVILVAGSAFTNTPSSVVLGRSISIFFASSAVILLYLIAEKLTNNKRIGILSSLLMAISPTCVEASRIIKPEPFEIFWELVALLFSVNIYKYGKTWNYVLAGLAIGFTASSKYNGALIAVCVVTAHFLRTGLRGLRDYRIYLSGFLSILGFIVITPYSILTYSKFLTDLVHESIHYSTGHPGMEGNAFIWYVSYLIGREGLIVLLAFIQVLRGFIIKSKEAILLSTFTVLYFCFVSMYEVRNDRTILPAIPLMILLGSMLMLDVYVYRNIKFKNQFWKRVLDGLVLILLFAIPLRNTVIDSMELTTIDSRTIARTWINENLPQGSRIAIERKSPYIDSNRFSIIKVTGYMVDRTPEWFVENDIDYLVFSEGTYGRFYLEPEKYKDWILRYDFYFKYFPLVRIFNDNGYEVRIHKLP